MEHYSTFKEFWPFYVRQHLNPVNRAFHWFGTSLAMVFVVCSVVLSAWFLIGAPVAGYGLAWFGHAFFERNKPATFYSLKFAWWSLLGDLKMWEAMVNGGMDDHIRRAVIRPVPKSRPVA